MTRLRRILSILALVAVSLPFCASDPGRASAERNGIAAGRCWRFAISGDGSEAYIPSPDRHGVWRVSLSDGRVLEHRRFGGVINALALNPGNSLLALSLGHLDRVVLVDPRTLEPGSEIPTGKGPRLLEFSDEGIDLCVLAPKSTEMDVIDVPSQRLDQALPLPARPGGFAHPSRGMVITLPSKGELLVLNRDHQFVAYVHLSPVPFWIARAGRADGNFMGHEGHFPGEPSPFPQDQSPGGFSAASEGGSARPTAAQRIQAREVLVATSNDSDAVTVIDANSLEVLAVVKVDDPAVVEAGCCARANAFVLSSDGKRVSVIDVDVSSRTFGRVRRTVKLHRPAEALSVNSRGVCYALSVSHHELAVIQPDGGPTEILKLDLGGRKHE